MFISFPVIISESVALGSLASSLRNDALSRNTQYIQKRSETQLHTLRYP